MLPRVKKPKDTRPPRAPGTARKPARATRTEVPSIASATRGMKWIVLTQNPQSRPKSKSKKWKVKRESTSYVDALMEYHNPVNDGLHILVLVSSEPGRIWEQRLNGDAG